ncbi:MAG: hypothetical protein BRD27_02950 [Bacteroidetes bacterium QH_10_64_19]|nr:MAG: hypothetical protein BRD27_02950 [Bacteroidetes bacterium QH_10_64_19]
MGSRPFICVLAVTWFAVLGGAAFAQPDTPSPPDPNESLTSDTADAEWESRLTSRLSVSQAAYKDWQEGGLSTLAFAASLDGATEHVRDRWTQAYDMRLAIGYINQEGREIRKSEDRIRLQANLQYNGDDFFRRFSPTIAADLRTQFASGFDYSEDPPVETSAFFAPAILTQSLGLTYDPYESLSLRLGVASKQTIVTEEDFRAFYGVDGDNLTRAEVGGQFFAALDQRLSENIRYQSQLDAFLAVNQLENPPDVIWENVVNMEVNNWITTDLEFVALFDKDTTDAIQLKEVISVGVSLTIL